MRWRSGATVWLNLSYAARHAPASQRLPLPLSPRRAVNALASLPFARHQLATSGLFDVRHYARATGLPEELDRCVSHYLCAGAGAGVTPNRLFDGDAYLSDYTDVADSGMDPFVHFVVHGLSEGRAIRVPKQFSAELAAIPSRLLNGRLLSEQARARGWNEHQPSRWSKVSVGVYASSLGNFFFKHIADRVANGLRASGIKAYRLDQNSDRPADVSVDIFVAPHEFFHLGGGRSWNEAPPKRVMLNTEQPGTTWYFLTLRHSNAEATIVDLSPHSAVVLAQLGRIRSGYFPLGLTPALHDREDALSTPPESVDGLEIVKCWDVQLKADNIERWRDRPIDVLFMGTLTSRRSRALARLAPTLARYRCFVHAPTGAGRPLVGEHNKIGLDESLFLARHAKILLNIHRGEVPYFEWHRVMMMGLEHGALVVSEPCLPSPGVVPGRHLLIASIEEMPSALESLLESSDGEQYAQLVQDFRGELSYRFDLKRELSALAFLHEEGFAHA